MKGYAFLIACTGLTALNSFGQGTLNFSNAGGLPLFRQSTGARVPVGSAFQVELMYAPDGTPLAQFDAAAVRLGLAVNFAPVPGYFAGGNRTINNLQPAGGFALLQVRVWETAYGASFDQAFATGDPNVELGKSFIIRLDTANPSIGEPPVLIRNVLTWQQGYPLSIVPEPSALVLGLSGAGAFLLFLRRKPTQIS